ncbi:hypothetical protein LTR09_007803 [Extremus antarcticus]|uniref:Uncharacterized protein n=1 Tax=Extremus antarcticus TaxID=702011 RepID=A0AAJ0DIV1_9PEZI|nr:hypothetical protein LTR09_007803 [Extremus antarcticus]
MPPIRRGPRIASITINAPAQELDPAADVFRDVLQMPLIDVALLSHTRGVREQLNDNTATNEAGESDWARHICTKANDDLVPRTTAFTFDYTAMYKAVHPPRRPARPDDVKKQKSVRIVPPSPALSTANLEAYNKSAESLSSVYSRSISGDKHGSRSSATLTAGIRSYNSGSTATVKESPLGAMRLASDPDVVMMAKESRRSMDGSDSDIDDAATLQARLPSVKAVSDFGDVQAWAGAAAEVKQTQKPTQTLLSSWDGPTLERPRLVVKRTRTKVPLRPQHPVTGGNDQERKYKEGERSYYKYAMLDHQ